MTETLHTCDKCGRGGFTFKGLKVHNCEPVSGSRMPARLAQFDQTLMGQQLEAQYKKALNGSFEILLFGAMMGHLEATVARLQPDRPKAGPGSHEGSVKAWIEEHSPAVNYKTAMGFKSLAVLAAKRFELNESELYRVLSTTDEDLSRNDRKTRLLIEQAIAGKSMRALQFEFRFARDLDAHPAAGKALRLPPPPRQFIRDSLKNLRRSCDEVKQLWSTMNKAETDNVCNRLLDMLEQLTQCGWSPDPEKVRGKRDFEAHAELSDEG